ncbi:uncharacterized protein LOC126851943 [Cataglyphis hispanica]|uniref:uncharacterized protein LOC126851943 n=1 Tax=Cataglyphis hispanica TaxID=1086592 RepID=UPI00218084FD|nr:uncharacterized protein LOC126851943 [Cataglyphis hispanica]
MIVRRCFAPTAVFVVLTLLVGFDGSAAERWSRQVSNSEWIPLANPRTAQLSQNNAGSGLLPASDTHLSNPIQSLALPSALQQQYQEQLIQLQKTQESIQKLLLLQQQLRAQQQLLQSQTFLPAAENEKHALPPSSLSSSQTAPESAAPEVLVPPHPSSEALPPLYPAQNFLPRRPGQVHQNLNNQELSNLPAQGQVVLQHDDDTQEGPHTYVKHGSQRPDGKHLKERPHPGLSQSPLIENNEEEEVQLVYVPAETLAQTGQRGRGRKQYPVRQQYHQRENQRNVEQTSLSPDQETYARQVLQQIQKEREEKAQFLKEERAKEFTRLNEEQKALERKTRLQQEALQREQELLRQKEAEKKRKELEKLEEMAKQRELERIREAREKQRQEELERRRLAELRAKEEKRREEEAREREERQKQLEQQRILEGTGLQQNPQALFREQVHRQHLADGRLKKIRGRQRQRVNQYQEQPNYREVTTTPSPNQPPLSVYMGSLGSRLESVKVTDVLKILKDAKTIAVLDNVGPTSPQVFVGPSNLDPPYGYAKFDLPYLSSIDHNRVERKVDKLPFFVAPLSFDPPPGYAKIPFPAPHIGSVVVNTLSETSPESNAQVDEQNPSPLSLIEPNSYNNADQSEPIATTASYASSTAQNFSPESSSAKYESPSSGSRFRFRQYYDNKPTSVISTSYYGEQSTTKTTPKQSYYEQESKSITQPPKFDTTDSYRQEISYSTPSFQDGTVSAHNPSTKKQDLAAHQLALINQELSQQIETQKYNAAEQYQANLGESYDANDVRAPVGPAQFNFPAELPPISPHLPGLINSLLDKQEENLPVTSTLPPTTTTPLTTTTAHVSSTTYRPRGRGRVIPTRPKTTQTPSNKIDRTRRPSYNRSKSRFSTTTEDYRETTYEPTKGKIPETTQKYNALEERRRPTSRTQKYRNRDRANSQSTQTHQAANYEIYPTQSDSQSNASPDAYSPTSGSTSNLYQKETSSSGISDYTRENYPSTTPTQTENYPLLHEIQHGSPLMSDDYTKSQNYPQNRPQDARYHQEATYDQNGAFEQPRLEQAPVNGFNYQVANENSPDQNIPQRHKEYSRYQENANYNHAITEDPRAGEEHRYSSIYEVNVAQAQPDYNIGGQNSFRNIDDGKIEDGAIEADPNASPIFIPLQQNKQEDYELQIPSTEASNIEIATTSTTTPAPVIIRQRVRGRLSGRIHQDSAVQTRPRGSQDEYVRFSVVNHDSSRGSNHRNRDGSRTKTRVRPQNHGSQVQTDGNEYIKIHAIQQQRLIATTTPSTTTTTTTTTTTARAEEEDVDYGFIRPPNFRPVQSGHPVDNRFPAPVTYRPALSEIQHIISNDETAVESSPTHVLKTRPKYNQIPTRQPTTKIFTTTTDTVPVATATPDNTVYTVKPKTRPDEPKQTRIRGRIRRPGKKRTMTNTESSLEANNELPLDENYPRITQQQLPVTRQQPLYDDNFDVPQFVPNQNRPTQFYEENSENDPPQEFILNFGNLPKQVSQREEYDQTQLASIPSSKYSHSDRASEHSSGDIYGAESQWSTKLSKTSFQPSFASNRMTDDESKRERSRIRDDQKNENAPEIITIEPEMPSEVTVVVSSDYQKSSNDGADAMIDSAAFGMKTNAQDHTEKKLNATTVKTTILQDRNGSDKETSFEAQAWMRDKEDNSMEQANEDTKMKKIADPLTGRKTRRRRVRVRVRPVSKDDFVTAESQHFNSAINSLVQDHYKYNSVRESKFTTDEPTTVIATTTIATETTGKSLLQDFLEEMLKNDEVSIPTRVTSIITEIPDRTILTPMTTPMTTSYITSDNSEVTTLMENYTQNETLTSNTIDEERVTMTNKSLTKWKNDIKETTSETTSEQIVHLSQEETKVQEEATSKEYWDENSQEDKSEQNNLENVEIFNQKYNLSLNYPDGSGTSRDIEDTIAELTNSPKEEIQKLSAINKGKEHIMTLKRNEKNDEGNDAHPKNHRIKWSEVKYPLTLDKSQSTLKLQFTTPIPGVVTRNEGDSSVKTLSDYVKAIFDSMKSAENQEEVEEIAKVVEAKNETPAKADQIIGTTDSSRGIYITQNIEENTTNLEKAQGITETTAKENKIFETTTLIPDTNTAVSSEETIITEPSTTTTPTTKTTIPIRRATDTVIRANSTQTMLGKVLRTSTTTKVSHMTEICYRGRCVMTRPKMDDVMER